MREWFLERIKKACEFYLKYKDNPKLLRKEYPEKAKIEIDYVTAEDIINEAERIVERYGKVEAQPTLRLKIIEYNEWLFKLAFKGVLKKEKPIHKDLLIKEWNNKEDDRWNKC